MFDGREPVYILCDPEMVKQLAVKDFDHWEDHQSFVDGDFCLPCVHNIQNYRFEDIFFYFSRKF